MSPWVVLGSAVLQSLGPILGIFGRKKEPSTPTPIEINVIEQEKDNTVIYAVVGLIVFVILLIVIIKTVGKK